MSRQRCPEHSGQYVAGCLECRAANARYANVWRLERLAGVPPRLVDATGTRRRIHGLYVLGWRARDIAARLGVSPEAVHHWTTRPLVTRRTALSVARGARELVVAGAGPSGETRRRALAAGMVPLSAWDRIDDPASTPRFGPARSHGVDLVAVERACAGERVALSAAERVEAVRVLMRRGLSDAEAGERLGMHERSVERIRRRHGIGPSRPSTHVSGVAS